MYLIVWFKIIKIQEGQLLQRFLVLVAHLHELVVALARRLLPQQFVAVQVLQQLALSESHLLIIGVNLIYFQIAGVNRQGELGLGVLHEVQRNAGVVLFVQVGNHRVAQNLLGANQRRLLENELYFVGVLVEQSGFELDLLVLDRQTAYFALFVDEGQEAAGDLKQVNGVLDAFYDAVVAVEQREFDVVVRRVQDDVVLRPDHRLDVEPLLDGADFLQLLAEHQNSFYYCDLPCLQTTATNWKFSLHTVCFILRLSFANELITMLRLKLKQIITSRWCRRARFGTPS